MARKYLAKLIPHQRRAVEHGCLKGKPDHRPLLVLAGAGTGKTHTISCRCAHLIANGAEPERMLLLVFGRHAAREMAKRAGAMASDTMGEDISLPWSGTFHSIAGKLLRRYAGSVGLTSSFSLLRAGQKNFQRVQQHAFLAIRLWQAGVIAERD